MHVFTLMTCYWEMEMYWEISWILHKTTLHERNRGALNTQARTHTHTHTLNLHAKYQPSKWTNRQTEHSSLPTIFTLPTYCLPTQRAHRCSLGTVLSSWDLNLSHKLQASIHCETNAKRIMRWVDVQGWGNTINRYSRLTYNFATGLFITGVTNYLVQILYKMYILHIWVCVNVCVCRSACLSTSFLSDNQPDRATLSGFSLFLLCHLVVRHGWCYKYN